MRTVAAAPDLFPGTGASEPRRILLACLEGQKLLRAYRQGSPLERWLRAWARRWYVVLADSADDARRQVNRYLDACARNLSGGIDASKFGIVEAGHNARNGFRRIPSELADRSVVRPSPTTRRRRPARARGPTGKGKRPL